MIEKPYIQIGGGAGSPGPPGPPGSDAEALIGTFEAAENISPPEYLVNIFDSGGEKIRKAIGNDINKQAHGFIKEAVLNGNTIEVYKKGSLTGLTGKNISKKQFLSNILDGQLTESTIFANGEGRQLVGEAVRTSEVYMNIDVYHEVKLV